MNNHNSMHKHIKNKLIQSISRLISSTEITPITTRTVLFNTDLKVFYILAVTEMTSLRYQSYIIQ